VPTPQRRFKDAIYEQLARIGKASAAPKRLELLDLLCQGPRTVEALAKECALSVANASQHLRVLRAARLVEGEKSVFIFGEEHEVRAEVEARVDAFNRDVVKHPRTFFSVRAATATVAPSRPRASAMSRPSPGPAPDTSATFPSSFPMAGDHSAGNVGM